MSNSTVKAATYAVVVTVAAMWMQVSYPLFGWLIHRLDGFGLENRTQGLLAVGVTLTIQISLLSAFIIAIQ